VICAALCVYLLIGIFWGCLFAVLESVAPGSFSGVLLEDPASVHETSRHLEYFSFVMLSTVGYGDITLTSRAAAALCQAEAIFGQFFVLVLIARLLGLQVAQQSRSKDS
jgi:voltage-gated potassium channel